LLFFTCIVKQSKCINRERIQLWSYRYYSLSVQQEENVRSFIIYSYTSSSIDSKG